VVTLRDTIAEFAEGRQTDQEFASHRELSDEARAELAESARNLVEEVLMSIPRDASRIEVGLQEARLVKLLFEQVVIDMHTAWEHGTEAWRRVRLNGIVQIVSLTHSMMIANSLVPRVTDE